MKNDSKLSLAFLYVCVSRLESKFCSSVFRKYAFSGLCRSHFNFCSFKFKLNIALKLLFFDIFKFFQVTIGVT